MFSMFVFADVNAFITSQLTDFVMLTNYNMPALPFRQNLNNKGKRKRSSGSPGQLYVTHIRTVFIAQILPSQIPAQNLASNVTDLCSSSSSLTPAKPFAKTYVTFNSSSIPNSQIVRRLILFKIHFQK